MHFTLIVSAYMRAVILIYFFFTTIQLVGQTPKYESYVNSENKLDTIFYNHSNMSVSILTAKKKSRNDILVWLTTDSIQSEPNFLGYIESETGFYLPNKQPLEHYFLIVKVSEFNGTLLLVKNNQSIEIPGYYYSVIENEIFTKASGDGDHTVAHYNLNSGLLTTKTWNNINGPDPWNIDSEYNYEEISWINMR